jgi:hypothetical protein
MRENLMDDDFRCFFSSVPLFKVIKPLTRKNGYLWLMGFIGSLDDVFKPEIGIQAASNLQNCQASSRRSEIRKRTRDMKQRRTWLFKPTGNLFQRGGHQQPPDALKPMDQGELL